ncbi:MAG: hypothetical protein DME42_02950 [Verrucomicrobia bacterium]|nr:MAG: hypothetical protein DME42_02950 [Verrucomicrobiota bacterium]
MKKFVTLVVIVVVALLFTTTASNGTVSAPTFTFNENGVGQLELPNGAVIPLIGTLAADPGPGGLSGALVFTTHPQEGAAFTVGDVFLTEHGGTISDVLRLNPATSSGTGLTQLMFLYSNDAGGLLADVGLPAAFYSNSVTITENENAITTFIPTTGQPGFLPVAPVPITYRIISMPDSGSTLLLLGLALSGLTVARTVTTSAVIRFREATARRVARRYRRVAIRENNFVVAR